MSYELLPESRYADEERCAEATPRGRCAKAWAYSKSETDRRLVCWWHSDLFKRERRRR